MGILSALLFLFGILNGFLGAISAKYYTSEKQRKWGYIRMYTGIAMVATSMVPFVYSAYSESLSIFTAFGVYTGITAVVCIQLIALILKSAFTD